MASDKLDPRFDPAFQRGFDGGATAPAGGPDVPAVPAVQPAMDAPSTLHGNPWVVVLWVLGPTLLVAGIWGLWQAQIIRTSPNTTSASSYYVLPGLLQLFAPWLAIVGLITIVGVVFLHAVRWRRRDA